VTRAAFDGQGIIIDGDRGLVILDPTDEKIEEYTAYIEQRKARQLSLGELASLESVTRDETKITLLGNIEFADEISAILRAGGAGVGLYRTEFLYLTRRVEPTEEDHFEAYKRCVDLLDGRPLVLRTVDLGADKHTQESIAVPERNPFLGCRSIRFCLKSLPMFKRQLRAMLRASAHGPISIMFPLISSPDEFRRARLVVHDVMEDLDDEGIEFDRGLAIGMMVEVPSAAIMSGPLAREADFFSIGTNDLVQYTLAVDRTNERVADLFNPAHPAVIRLIREVVKSARRHDIPVSCCGESAGEPEYAMLLIGLGVRTLSVTASSMAQLKRLVRSVTISQCERVAKRALSFDSDVEVSAFLRDQARKIIPEASGGRAAGD
jgi:phosphotransferase system enzyme I (PtsI)